MGNGNASMAGQKETASEKKADKNPLLTDFDDDEDEDEDEYKYGAELFSERPSAADLFGNCGVLAVLFETPSGYTPSGFAIFEYDAVKLADPDAWQYIWADFVNDLKAVIWVEAFETFEGKGPAITNTYVSQELSSMILKHVGDEQTLAVGNEDYKNVIQDRLKIPCVYSPVVKELMWGLRNQIRRFLPVENSEMTNEDRFPMSEGMIFFLDNHNFDINPHMMVTKRIIKMAGILYECDYCLNKYDAFLRLVAEDLLIISGIRTRHWDLLKLATALKMICDPEDEIPDARQLFSKRQLKRLMKDAPRYQFKNSKNSCLEVYKEMYSAHKMRLEVSRVLVSLLKRAKKAYEHEQAGKAASDPEIGPDRKKICRGFAPVMIDELTEWHTMLSAKRKERQVPPTIALVDALERYTQISSHPLNMTNRPGILSMDIHPSKDIVATGGIDTNVVLFDFPSSQILCTLTGHSKKITSLKFVNGNGLFITGSADKVGEPSGQEGYISASFHPGGLILGTGTLDGAVKIWDVKTQTAGLDGVKIWDLRTYGDTRAFDLSNYYSDTPINAGNKDWSVRWLDAMDLRALLFGLLAALHGNKQGWDPITKTMDADDEWWKTHLAYRSEHAKFRNGPPANLEQQDVMFRKAHVTGESAAIPGEETGEDYEGAILLDGGEAGKKTTLGKRKLGGFFKVYNTALNSLVSRADVGSSCGKDDSVPTMKEFLAMVRECGVEEGTDLMFTAGKLALKREHRELLAAFATNAGRLDYLKRTHAEMNK